MPRLKEFHAKYASKELVLIGVHTVRSKDRAPAYIRDQKIGYPVAFDTGEERTINTYLVDSFPDYYLIDKHGVLRFADVANADWSNIESAVEKLLAEPGPKPKPKRRRVKL